MYICILYIYFVFLFPFFTCTAVTCCYKGVNRQQIETPTAFCSFWSSGKVLRTRDDLSVSVYVRNLVGRLTMCALVIYE